MSDDYLFIHGAGGHFIRTPEDYFRLDSRKHNRFCALPSPAPYSQGDVTNVNPGGYGSYIAANNVFEVRCTAATDFFSELSCDYMAMHDPGKRLTVEFSFGYTERPGESLWIEIFFATFGPLSFSPLTSAIQSFDFIPANPDAWYRMRIPIHLFARASYSSYSHAFAWTRLEVTLEDIPT